MIHVLVRHNVEDYNTWKPFYDSHGAFRKEIGSQGLACSVMPTTLPMW